MSFSAYDEINTYYQTFIRQGLQDPRSHFSVAVRTLLDTMGQVKGLRICDLACGEGHLSRRLARRGALVTGVDISSKLLDLAASESAEGPPIKYMRDDARWLDKLEVNAFDVVVCNMALMDMPNLDLTYRAVRRVLKHNGQFLASLLHPCFETPFTVPNGIVEKDEEGRFVACRVMRYTEEGYWNSGGEGMRGKVGAYHRQLSTYINKLIECGFQLKGLYEPTLPPLSYQKLEEQWFSKIPRVLIIHANKN